MKKVILGLTALVLATVFTVSTVNAGTTVPPKPLLYSCLLFSNNILFMAAGMPPMVEMPASITPILNDIGEFYMNTESIKNPFDLQLYILNQCLENDGDLTKLVPVRKKDVI